MYICNNIDKTYIRLTEFNPMIKQQNNVHYNRESNNKRKDTKPYQ